LGCVQHPFSITEAQLNLLQWSRDKGVVEGDSSSKTPTHSVEVGRSRSLQGQWVITGESSLLPPSSLGQSDSVAPCLGVWGSSQFSYADRHHPEWLWALFKRKAADAGFVPLSVAASLFCPQGIWGEMFFLSRCGHGDITHGKP
jgi:hypothetical protein